jgi:cytochrome P450
MTDTMQTLSSPMRRGTARSPSIIAIVRRLRSGGWLEFLMDLWRTQGDLPHLRAGLGNVMVVIHPDHVRHISITARQSFDKLNSYEIPRVLLLGDGLIASKGVLWKRQRRLMSSFFSPRSIEQYYPVMLAAAERTAHRWESVARTGTPIDVINEMMLMTAWIIVQSMFGADVTDERLNSLQGDIEDLIGFVTRRGFFPVQAPMWMPLPSHRRYRAARARVFTLIQDVIARRRSQPRTAWPDDLLSKLMLARDEETGEAMTDMLLRDESLGIFIAGHETTARTMSFLLLALNENPGVEARLHAELDSVLPRDEAPTLEHLKRLPYTLQVIKEVLRLYPPAPAYARDTAVEHTMDGVRVPAGTVMLLFPYATHRHPAFWEEPERFDPDRWLPEREAARHPYAYHPFAAGHRICLGNNFAMLEAHILTALLVRRFRARLVAGHRPELDLAGLLIVRNGLPMVLTRR